MSTSEGQHMWDGLEIKHERQDWGGMVMYGGKMMGILREGCWGWSCQERGNGEGQKGGLWMWWKRTWLRLKWRNRIQKIGTIGNGKSAVATPDGKSRKKKNNMQRNAIRKMTSSKYIAHENSLFKSRGLKTYFHAVMSSYFELNHRLKNDTAQYNLACSRLDETKSYTFMVF